MMDAPLSPRERELVALGAAMGCSCAPCIKYHIPVARKTGISDAQIGEALKIADQIRRAPARRAMDAASEILGMNDATSDDVTTGSACSQRIPVDGERKGGCWERPGCS